MTCDSREWDRRRLAKVEELIEAYEDAILQLSSGAVQSYHLDTGQTRTSVTTMHLSQLKSTLSELEAKRDTYLSRLGCGRRYIRPVW